MPALSSPRLLVLGAAALASAAWLATRGDETSDAPPDAAAPPSAALAPGPVLHGASDRALASLRAEIAELRRRLDERTEPADGEPADGDTPAALAAELATRDPDEIRDAAEARARARIALFADALAADPDDPTWSGQAADRVRSSFVERLPADATLEDVSCRSSLCRITVRFATAQAGEIGSDRLPTLVPWDTRGILHRDEHDPARIVLYAARRGDLAPN